MTIELHRYTVMLSAADGSAFSCPAAHRAAADIAHAAFSQALSSAHISNDALIRSRQGLGRVHVEATDTGIRALAGLPGVTGITPFQPHAA